jgi:hypothetical protein
MTLKIKYFYTLLLFFLSSSWHLYSQVNIDNSAFQIESSVYKKFDGELRDVYLIETNYCVVQIDKTIISNKQLSDSTTLVKLFNRIDKLYDFFKTNLPEEPAGGNPKFSFKTDIFFGNPSCGSGCGLVGSKGIEVSGFDYIYYNLKYNLNVNRDVIISYELGRNFSNNSIDKISFSSTPKNGGFYENFAAFMTVKAFDLILEVPSQRYMNETLMNKKWDLNLFRAYINDLEANPFNSWANWDLTGARDPVRGKSLPGLGSYPSLSFTALDQIFDFEILDFVQNLNDLDTPFSVQDALSNFAWAFSKAVNKDLSYFFKNVLKFDINEDAEQYIKSLPAYQDHLIADREILWFISPEASIPLNIRSINYLKNEDAIYRVIIDDEFYSESKHGNNSLPYSVLKNKNSVNLRVELEIDNVVIDTYSSILRKRHNLNIIEEFEDELHSHYLNNPFHKSSIEAGTLRIESLVDNIDEVGATNLDFMISKNRIYEY